MNNENGLMVQNGLDEIHVRYNGVSHDIPMNDLDVGLLSSDEDIKSAVGTYLGVPADKLSYFQVDRNEQESVITLRPAATFGA